jgi:raffinose/stachyose/melibiose transport system permease protein
MKIKLRKKNIPFHIILIITGFLWCYPFLWMISASFKTQPEFFSSRLSLIAKSPTLDNFLRVWGKGNFGIYFFNSLLITSCSVLLVLIMTRTAGYVMGRYKFVGRNVIMGIFISSISIPLVSTIIPIYQIVKSMGLVGTRLGVILSGAGGAHVIFLLLFSSFYQQIPGELEEASKIDGCNFLQTYSYVMKPLANPIAVTTIIMETIWTWNAFLLPLVLTLNNPNSRTLAVGLYSFKGENTIDWTGIATGATISVIPIIVLFIVLQKYVVNGVAGAVKN